MYLKGGKLSTFMSIFSVNMLLSSGITFVLPKLRFTINVATFRQRFGTISLIFELYLPFSEFSKIQQIGRWQIQS